MEGGGRHRVRGLVGFCKWRMGKLYFNTNQDSLFPIFSQKKKKKKSTIN